MYRVITLKMSATFSSEPLRLKVKGCEKIYNENTKPKRLRWLYSGVEGKNKTINLEFYIQ